ncbi:NADH-dependent butanol dehydrogenase A [Clostridia bacterium]|nr:NADH-dependent butanol dehydrogenase A [Clostridia bacterium]
MKTFTNFDFNLYTEIVFGKDTEKDVGALIQKHGGTRVLFVYGAGSIKKSGLYDRVVRSLQDAGLFFTELSGVKANPKRSLVEEGIRIAQSEGTDFYLAVGGGSAIDTAKGIALAMANDGEYWAFFNGTSAKKMAPVGTINTIAAAGSETSLSAVLVDDINTGYKQSVAGNNVCRPVFAIMNPELTYSVSKYQTAAGATDIFAHTYMRYFTNYASFLGDRFCESVLKTVLKYAQIAIEKPDGYEARAELMLAAAFSHNELTGVGRAGDRRGGEHGLEVQLSGYYDTAHGAGLAVMMPAYLKYIILHGTEEQVARVAGFGIDIFGVHAEPADVTATAYAGIRAFESWLRSIEMPTTLAELGVPKAEIQAAAARALNAKGGHISGFIELDPAVAAEIYQIAAGTEPTGEE